MKGKKDKLPTLIILKGRRRNIYMVNKSTKKEIVEIIKWLIPKTK